MPATDTIARRLLPEFDHEMAGARVALERAPEDRYDWKPHARSWTLRELVTHIAQLPQWGSMALDASELDLAPVGAPRPMRPEPVRSRAELLARFDAHVAATREALERASDEHMRGMWELKLGGRTIRSMSRRAVLRGFVLSHMIHHRAQLGVYLRLCDVPVPMQYGPTADEGTMG